MESLHTNNDAHIQKIRDIIKRGVFKKNPSHAMYFASTGLTHTDLCVWREINHHFAHIFFKTLDALGLDYYIFAGTSVGYVRNARSIPWADDYDIILMTKDITKFEKDATAALTAHGFSLKRVRRAGMQVYCAADNKQFLCDVFYSFVDGKGFLRNVNQWGRYTSNRVPWNIVSPAQRLTVDGDLTVPFFANYARDVEIEYGNVHKTSVFHIKHCPAFTVNAPFEDVYAAFELVLSEVIERTRAHFADHAHDLHVTLPPVCKFKTPMECLSHVHMERAHTVCFSDPMYLKFCSDIAMYLPDVRMHFCMTSPVPDAYVCFIPYATQVTYVNKHDVDSLLERAPHVFARRQPQFVSESDASVSVPLAD